MAELAGYLLTIDAIITWSAASLVYKSGLSKTDPKANLLFRLVCVTLGTFIFSLLFGNYLLFESLTSEELISYLIPCIISGLTVTAGDMLYFVALTKIDASRAFPLTQLSLVFIYPLAFIFFGEEITIAILIGGTLILSSVFLLSSKDKQMKNGPIDTDDKSKEDLLVGVMLGVGTALMWALSGASFHQARIISNDVFVTNFIRMSFALVSIATLGLFQREYYAGFKKENRDNLKYYVYIGVAGALSLGFADSLFYKAAEINGLILTSSMTANTPIVQQTLSVLILKEKFRKRFFFAIGLIILGNYLILFL